jgi:hypothetical protein
VTNCEIQKNAGMEAIFGYFGRSIFGSLSRYERCCHVQKKRRNDAAVYVS